MNHADRGALGIILDQLWETRNPGNGHGDGEGLDMHQRELLAAAMRIVAGDPNSSTLPNPWPVSSERWETEPRPHFDPQPGWRDRLITWLARR